MSQAIPSAIAVIPARGGSKGIPGKNLREIGGVPLIGRAVIAAKRAISVSRVFVSTDDRDIAAAAESYGAEIVWRPAELASDTASSEAALLHALQTLEEKQGLTPDLLIFIQCTSPFVTSVDIDGCVGKLIDAGADSAFTAVRTHHFLWRYNGTGEAVEGINHNKAVRLRRQDRQPEFMENGAVYVMKCTEFRNFRHRFFGKTVCHPMESMASIEIDDPADLSLAAAIATTMLGRT